MSVRYVAVVVVFLVAGCSDTQQQLNGEDNRMGLSREQKISNITKAGSSGQTEQAREIAQFLSDKDSEIAGQACFYIGYLGSRDFIPEMLAHLDSSDPTLINFCLSGLAFIAMPGESALASRAAPLLDHSSVLVRMSAVTLIGKVGDARFAELLMDRLMGAVPAVQLEMVRALGDLGAQRALPLLSEMRDSMQETRSTPNLGGVRGSDPHPDVMKAELADAIAKLGG